MRPFFDRASVVAFVGVGCVVGLWCAAFVACAALAPTVALASALQEDGASEDGASEDVPGGAFVDVRTDRETYFVGQAIRVRLRFGFEETFFAENLTQLFRRRLEIPVRIEAPWVEGLGGARLDPASVGDDEPDASASASAPNPA